MEKLVFYFDRNFGKRLPELIAKSDPPFAIKWQHSPELKLPQEMPDDEWLELCGKNGWIALSHDRKFHSNATERHAIKSHKVGAIYLPGANEKLFRKLFYFIAYHEKLILKIQAESKPFILQMQKLGKIKKIEI